MLKTALCETDTLTHIRAASYFKMKSNDSHSLRTKKSVHVNKSVILIQYYCNTFSFNIFDTHLRRYGKMLQKAEFNRYVPMKTEF